MGKKINFTVQEIVEAGLADETAKTQHCMVDYSTGATCAVGGAATVLGVDPDLMESAIERISITRQRNMASYVEGLNDGTTFKKATIWKRLLAKLTPEQLATKVRIAPKYPTFFS